MRDPESPPAEMVVADEEEYRRLPGTIEMYRAGLALARGDIPGTVRHAQRALELAPDDDHLCRASAAALLGLVYWGSGDLEAGHRAYSACVAGLRRAGFVADILGCSIALADIRITQGRLGEALRTYEQALQLGPEQGGPVLRGTADMHVGMSEIARERDDLRAATQHLLRSQELGEHTGLPQNRYRWRVAMARVAEAEGNLAGALDLLNEAERLYVSDFFPNVRPVPALKARVWIAQGRLGEALGWAREQGLSVDDDLSYLREFEHITLARLLLARHEGERAERSLHEATRLLERLLLAAEEGGRTGRVIEILVLRALAHQALGDIPAALASLERAVTLAEPEGYVRVFADEGPPMAALLRAAAKQGTSAELCPPAPGRRERDRARQPHGTGPDRAAERTRTRRAAAARNRAGRPGHRPRAHGVPEHHADSHQEHLRQARGDQPPGSGPPGRGTRPAVANPQPPPLTRPAPTPGAGRPPVTPKAGGAALRAGCPAAVSGVPRPGAGCLQRSRPDA